LTLAALGLALLVAGVGAPPASAQCGGVQKARPKHRLNRHGRAPLAIGDSVMLLALPRLADEGYRVNAHGCRGWSEGMAVLRAVKRRQRLPHMVVMALGADFSITPGEIRSALHLLPRNRVLALVTPRELGGGSGSDAANVRAAARKHRHRVMLLDWVRYSAGRSGWFQADGIHLTFAGAAGFARMLGKATPYAKPGRFPNGASFPR
jgi:hypothetical protein